MIELRVTANEAADLMRVRSAAASNVRLRLMTAEELREAVHIAESHAVGAYVRSHLAPDLPEGQVRLVVVRPPHLIAELARWKVCD